MLRKTATLIAAASLLAAVPLAAPEALTISRYGGGVGNSQTPARYGGGGYSYGGSGGYVSINMSSPISRQHSSSYYAREDALARIRAARVQPPCGQYARQPVSCKASTLSYRRYEAMNR